MSNQESEINDGYLFLLKFKGVKRVLSTSHTRMIHLKDSIIREQWHLCYIPHRLLKKDLIEVRLNVKNITIRLYT